MKNFKTTLINHQEWMSENLNFSNFKNGDPIPYAKSNEEWIEAAKTRLPAWCYPSHNGVILDSHGKLYNKFAVNDPRGLAPEGFVIPSNVQYGQLIEMLDGHIIAAIKMKSTDGWEQINLGNSGKFISGCGTNESHFNAYPTPYRDEYGEYHYSLYEQFYWTNTDYINKDTKEFNLDSFYKYGTSYAIKICDGNYEKYPEDNIRLDFRSNGAGLSVRCVNENSQLKTVNNSLQHWSEECDHSYYSLIDSFFNTIKLYVHYDEDYIMKKLRETSVEKTEEGRQDDKL